MLPSSADPQQVIAFWSARYPTASRELDREHYDRWIGKPLTPEGLRHLFLWKMSPQYFKATVWPSVETHFLPRLLQLNDLAEQTTAQQFLDAFPKGGLIARVFLMHCRWPQRIPIFDQHVFRAMCMMIEGRPRELPAADRQRERAYLEEYLPFVHRMAPAPIRDVDRAMWTYGKFIKPLAWG